MLYESAILGGTGSVGGYVANFSQFIGVRFVLAAPATTSRIGIHGVGSGTIFGAVVALSSLADFPDSTDLSTPDVRGSALITLVDPSAEVSAPLVLNLPAGVYALLFGSGILGATGDGAAPYTNTDIGTPSYYFSSGGLGGIYVDGGLSQVRMFLA